MLGILILGGAVTHLEVNRLLSTGLSLEKIVCEVGVLMKNMAGKRVFGRLWRQNQSVDQSLCPAGFQFLRALIFASGPSNKQLSAALPGNIREGLKVIKLSFGRKLRSAFAAYPLDSAQLGVSSFCQENQGTYRCSGARRRTRLCHCRSI